MKLLLRHQALLVLVAGLMFLTNLGGHALYNDEESKTAASSAEMFRHSAWIVPTFNEQLQVETPILIHWFMELAFRLFGISEFSARLVPSLMAIGTSLLTYHLGRKLYSSDVGFLAGIILSTCLFFSAMGRTATPDSTLVFFTTLAFTGYVWTVTRQRGASFSRHQAGAIKSTSVAADSETEIDESTSNAPSLAQRAFQSCLFVAPVFAPMGLGVLTSGPAAFILPSLVLLMFILLSLRIDDLDSGALELPAGPKWKNWIVTVGQIFRPKKVIETCREINLPFGIALVAAIALPWFVVVSVMTQGAWLRGFFLENNLNLVFAAKDGRNGFHLYPIYQLVVVHLGCFPWSVFLPVAIYRLWERLNFGAAWRESDRLLACWIGVWFVFYSVCGTKSLNSLLPAYPALALVLARFFTDWKRDKVDSGVYSFNICCRAMWIAGFVIALALSIVTYSYFPTEQWLGLIGLVPVIGGFVATKFLDQERRPYVMRTLITTSILFTFAIVGVALTRIGRYQDSPLFIADAKTFAKSEDIEIGTYDYFEPSVVFYAGKKVRILTHPRQVAEFISSSPRAYVITKGDKYTQNALNEVMFGNATELSRHKNFFRGRELVLIGRN
jgi:4-amino-4-deoxy-L-arabinose transferase-like glycosyltransferase